MKEITPRKGESVADWRHRRDATVKFMLAETRKPMTGKFKGLPEWDELSDLDKGAVIIWLRRCSFLGKLKADVLFYDDMDLILLTQKNKKLARKYAQRALGKFSFKKDADTIVSAYSDIYTRAIRSVPVR